MRTGWIGMINFYVFKKGLDNVLNKFVNSAFKPFFRQETKSFLWVKWFLKSKKVCGCLIGEKIFTYGLHTKSVLKCLLLNFNLQLQMATKHFMCSDIINSPFLFNFELFVEFFLVACVERSTRKVWM